MEASPRMYEIDSFDFGGKKPVEIGSVLTEENINVLDLDTQEASFDLQQLILNAEQGLPNQPLSTASVTDLLNHPVTSSNQLPAVQDDTAVYQTVPQMPVQLFMQPEEPAIPKNFDLSTESPVDIQALLAYTGANVAKDEKPAELPSCSLQTFQAELERSSPDTSPAQGSSTAVSSPASRAGRKGKCKKRFPEKGSNEYFEKRARNNIAVRKSRTKAKQRQAETEGRVKVLTDENERLQKKVDLLSKELNVLKSLFLNVGAALPSDFESVLQK